MLNTMTENESNIFLFPSFLLDFDCKSWYMILFSVIIFKIMKFLAILAQVKVGQNYDSSVI